LVQAVSVFKLDTGSAQSAAPVAQATVRAPGSATKPYAGVEKRSPNRPFNAARIQHKPTAMPKVADAAGQKTGTDDWENF
jgi:hypothetical protein